ncbi:hypothetical protein E4U21_006465 [Claviceps maximensis]|nr:hypothetical protein E4U21_006465 [Claviceps maximensis]
MGSQQSKNPSSSRPHDKPLVQGVYKAKLQNGSATSSASSSSSSSLCKMTNEKTGVVARDAEPLSLDVVSAIPGRFLEDGRNRLALSALSSANPQTVLTSQASKITNQHLFNAKISSEGAPMTNQRSSGRCWLFAATNVFRVALMSKYNVESFELSQNYLYYWDKLEKSNWFLEQMMDTAAEDLEGRLVQRLLEDPVSDGGQWDMVYNLVDKYGLVPQALYPDSWNAKNSSVLNAVLKTKLRGFALKLRREVSEAGRGRQQGAASVSVSRLKADMMEEIQHIITLLLGPTPTPTKEFLWTYVDKDNKVHELSMTPRDFANSVAPSGFQVMMTSSLSPPLSSCSPSAMAMADMVSLVNDPRNEYLRPLTVHRLGNVVGGRNTTYLNVDMGTMKAACVKMIRAGCPIFFGCDVGKFSDKASGVMDLAIFDYEAGLRTDLLGGMTKEERLRAGESLMTHAMVLTAVHLDDRTGKPLRWRVQNSWGVESGERGWFVMSDAWMDEWVYQAVVDQKVLSKEVRDSRDREPVVLSLWDPMGALA